MRTRVQVKEKELQPENGCHHFWVIEEANGPSSRGICKHCGQAKEFYNAMPDFAALKKNPELFGLPHMGKVHVDKDSKS
jgi:hypothetical protein